MSSKIANKLVAAMKEIGVVDKRGSNTKQQYKYVKATDVANEVREALATAGVSFTFDVENERTWEKQTNSGGMMFFCSLTVRGTFTDGESGEQLSGRAIGWGADSLDKAPYKAMTGALKYILRMNFLIPDEEDPEQDNDHYEKVQHSPAQKPAPQASAPKSNGNGKTITEPQQKRLFAITRTANADKDSVKKVLELCGYKASADILMSDYNMIVELFESGRWADKLEEHSTGNPANGSTTITDDDLPF